MEYLVIIGALLAILGMIGAIIPALPGPTFSFAALLLLFFAKGADEISVAALIWFGIVMAVLVILDYVAPAFGAKYFGATKYGIIGAIVGVVLGTVLIFPWGIILGPFLGAFLGELAGGKDPSKAAKAGLGTVMGVFATTVFQFFYTVVVAIYFFVKLF